MIVSFNNHFDKPVDYKWRGSMPLDPAICFDVVFVWLRKLDLPKSQIHSIVLPSVREGLVLAAYHALMGHFPTVMYSMRNGGEYVWKEASLQDWRDEARGRR